MSAPTASQLWVPPHVQQHHDDNHGNAELVGLVLGKSRRLFASDDHLLGRTPKRRLASVCIRLCLAQSTLRLAENDAPKSVVLIIRCAGHADAHFLVVRGEDFLAVAG